MPEKWVESAIGCAPFISLSAGKVNINWQQIVQTAIVGLVGGALVAYVSVVRLETSFEYIEARIESLAGVIGKVDDKVEEMRRDIYKPHLGEHE